MFRIATSEAVSSDATLPICCTDKVSLGEVDMFHRESYLSNREILVDSCYHLCHIAARLPQGQQEVGLRRRLLAPRIEPSST